jgi:hypothetical protein
VEGRDGRVVSSIWGKREAEFLCKQNWTGQIALIRHDKLFFLARIDTAASTA